MVLQGEAVLRTRRDGLTIQCSWPTSNYFYSSDVIQARPRAYKRARKTTTRRRFSLFLSFSLPAAKLRFFHARSALRVGVLSWRETGVTRRMGLRKTATEVAASSRLIVRLARFVRRRAPMGRPRYVSRTRRRGSITSNVIIPGDVVVVVVSSFAKNNGEDGRRK